MSSTMRNHATRLHPEAAGLDASLHHVDGWPVLSIPASPQTLELQLVNRTPWPVAAAAARVELLFRPGILIRTEELALAPQSDAQWVLSVRVDAPEGNLVLSLIGAATFGIEPGGSLLLRIDGFSANPAGGSRETRVECGYSAFFHAAGTEVRGRRLMPLSVLRRHEPAGIAPAALRTGSIAESGPFTAGFVAGADLLNDGKSANRPTLRIVNTSGRPLPLSVDGDAATRIHLSFRTGSAVAPWGLLGPEGDHLAIDTASPGWQIDAHTIRRTAAGAWAPREAVELQLEIHSQAVAGQAQLVLSYENLPDADDGELVLLVTLGGLADRPTSLDVVRPLALHGEQARLEFHVDEAAGADASPGEAGTTAAASIAINPSAQARGRLEIDAPAGVLLDGSLLTTANHIDLTSESFSLGGAGDWFYPVVIDDLAWHDGELRIDIVRDEGEPDTAEWGSMLARIACHAANRGRGSEHWSIELRQSRIVFGGFANARNRPSHVLWLAGNSTYSWTANHPARLFDRNGLAKPSGSTLPPLDGGTAAEIFNRRQLPDPAFGHHHVAISRSMDRDTSPVPSGVVVMWSGSVLDIPWGWGLCDGKDGRPDLVDRFVLGAGGQAQSGQKGEADRHSHRVAPQSATTSSDGAHGHKFPAGWYKRDFYDGWGGRHSGIDTNGNDVASKSVEMSGSHSHDVSLRGFATGEAAASRPRWFALCFIVKL